MNFELKYKPEQFSDLVFANSLIASRLQHFFLGQQSGHILLHGPYGSGKTSAAKILVSSRVGNGNDQHMCLHSSELKKDLVQKIYGCAKFADALFEVKTKPPYVLIDEIDQLDMQSQNQLRKLADSFNIVKFVFTTNVPHAMDQGLRNRCTEFQLKSPTAVDWFSRAKHIIQAEGIPLDDNALKNLLATCSDTSARKIMGVLDSAAARLKPQLSP